MMKQILKILLLAILFSGCASTYPNTNPVGKMFPSVNGETLEKKEVKMPSYFKGTQTLLLVGYKQDTQFDIDRWLIGLDMSGAKVKAFELPAIQGMFPRMFSTTIDNGMRKGIPKELWGGVITIYADGSTVQEFTGNENGNNARVLLLDASGKIQYFYDRGFSVAALNEVKALIKTTP